MQAPIPDDWINDAWVCYALQWPDSTKWLAILNGLLSNPRQGRFWNAQSGSIKDAQAVGADIWYRNQPLVSCADADECPTIYIDRVVYLGGCGSDCEECDMTCVKPNDFEQRADGLYLYCGCDWVKIFDIATIAEDVNSPELGDDPLVPPGETIPTYYACGKAVAAVDILFKTAGVMWDTGLNDYPWEWPRALRNELPELSGGLTPFLAGASQAVIVDAGYDKEFTIDADLRDLLECRLAERLDDDDLGLTDEDFQYALDVVYDYFPISQSATYALIQRFWYFVFEAIGRGDLRNLSRLGATTQGDCTCPNEVLGLRDYFPPPPAGMDWDYTFDFRLATLHPAITLASLCHHNAGVGVWGDCGATNNNNQARLDIALDQVNNGSVAKYVHFVWETPGLSDDYNNSTGCTVKFEDTEHFGVAEMETVSGATPGAGTWTLTKTINDALGAAEDAITLSVNGYHITGSQLDDVAANSFKLIGLRIAGTGPGPMSNPPA